MVVATMLVIALIPEASLVRGFEMGFIAATGIAMVLWMAWVPSGLANRGLV